MAPSSRLARQVLTSEELDGLKVRLTPSCAPQRRVMRPVQTVKLPLTQSLPYVASDWKYRDRARYVHAIELDDDDLAR